MASGLVLGGTGQPDDVQVSNLLTMPKRLLVGRPLRSERLGDTLLPKKLALPVFCSDPLSPNALPPRRSCSC